MIALAHVAGVVEQAISEELDVVLEDRVEVIVISED